MPRLKIFNVATGLWEYAGSPGATGPQGNPGATGATGPSGLTVDGNISTRVAGAAGEITRANLASDVAFSSRYVAVPTAWVAFTYASTGWAAYGGGYSVPGYRKVGDHVELRGLLNCPGGIGVTASVATLPVGFRPPNIILAWVGNSGGIIKRVDISTGGLIQINSYVAGEWYAFDDLPGFSI